MDAWRGTERISAIQLGYDVDWIYYMNNKNE